MDERDLTITGLTEQQCLIADVLWKCSSEEEMEVLYKIFDRDEVEGVKQLMLAAAFDQIDDLTRSEEHTSELQSH